ncbi:hypothetical protein BDV96DRAFT_648416 [Lophiotrema nucula]|uniref:RING-type domain-containing protein n=1 Tax=Lophiotrema nucula TaxID=690887 RepID=A0A6A5Z4V2_9PLEO|nr:hypothetical protein BDV96DRAFT_648416 [Lophiotrema nucula]
MPSQPDSAGTTTHDPVVDQECPICYFPFNTPRKPYFSLPEHPVKLHCSHIFGSRCIDTWLSTSPTCPLCRSEYHDPYYPRSRPPSTVYTSMTTSNNSTYTDTEGTIASDSIDPEIEQDIDDDIDISEEEAQIIEQAMTSMAAMIRRAFNETNSWKASWEENADVEVQIEHELRDAEPRMRELEQSHREWMSQHSSSSEDEDEEDNEAW